MTDAQKPGVLLVRVNARIHPHYEETNVSGVFPPLGLAYLAGSARDAGYRADILDAHALNIPAELTSQRVLQSDAKVVGLTASTFSWPMALDMARRIKHADANRIIIVGGPHLCLYPEECLADPAIDAGVIGEGERTLIEILQRVERSESLAGMPGVVARIGDRIELGDQREPIENLDDLPLPALDLLPMNRYHGLTIAQPFVSMITSRGCPFRCRYCSQIFVGGKHREHSPDRVLNEIARAVNDFGAKEIVFFDETFTMRRDRVIEICNGILERGIRVRWNVRTRFDRIDEELLAKMHEAGCHSVHLGVESGSERVQKLMNKNLNLSKLKPALEAAKRIGIESRGYFMIGFPGETLDEMEQSIRLATELPLDWASFTITFPAAGTEIFEQGVQAGLFDENYWRDYTLGKVDKPPGYFTSDGISAETLESMVRKAYRRFYLRPGVIAGKARWRFLRELPSIARIIFDNRFFT
jgi:radical SAM superfamily enzyme YgiQ (UPF0313 family)